IRERLLAEKHPQLKVAYASALGKLGDETMLEEFFRLLQQATYTTARGELGLAIARLVGDERYYLQHWHSFRTNLSTAAAQALLDLQKQLQQAGQQELARLAADGANAFGTADFSTAWEQLKTLVEASAEFAAKPVQAEALNYLAQILPEDEGHHFELALLALHMLNAVWHPERQ
ncbi:MAG: hypothetical protein GXP38_01730, partial [Chloroflexi bacterium]|nr:hypothetical protein [Chloroflexota bacterium]